MTLSHVASSAWVSSVSSVTPGVPAGTAAGDLVLITLVSKYDDAVLGGAPSGWTDLGTAINTGSPTGNDAGNMRGRLFSRIWQAGDTMPALAPSPNNVSTVKASTYRVAAGKTFSLSGGIYAGDQTSDPRKLEAGSTLGGVSGDILHVDCVVNGDVVTFSTMTLSHGGTSTTNTADTSTASGTDLEMRSVRYALSSTVTANLVWNITVGGTANTRIVGTILRIREVNAGAALTETPTDAEGLTDAATVVQGHEQPTTDALGLVDDATVTLTPGGGGGGSAISATVLASAGDSGNLDAYTTTSVAPAANKLLLVFGLSSGTNPTPVPTVTGLGLTWTMQHSNQGAKTQWCAYAVTGGSAPTPGSLTITHGAAQTGLAYSILEVTNADLSAPIVQSNHERMTSTATSATVTLSALADATYNAVIGGFFTSSGEVMTPDAGYTELSEVTHSAPLAALATIIKVPGTTTPGITYTTASISGGVAVEVNAAPAGGGTNLTESPTDAEGLTDSTTLSQAHASAPTDAEGLTDTATAAQAHISSAADLLGLTDTATVLLIQSVAVTDALPLTDSAVVQQNHLRPTTDAEGLTDSALVQQGQAQRPTDALGLADAATTALTHAVTPVDLEGLTDTATVSRGIGQPATDALGLSDAATVSLGHARPTTDAEGLNDAAVLAQGHAVRPTDALGLADFAQVDLITPGADNWTVDATDPMGMSDSATVVLMRAYSEAPIDGEGLSDATVVAMQYVNRPTDALNLSDAATTRLDHVVRPTDALGITDAVSIARNLGVTQTDLLGLTDTLLTVARGLGLNVGDSEGLTDTATVNLAVLLTQAVSDALGLSDSATVLLMSLLSQSVTDVAGLTDAVVAARSLASLPTDSIGVSDLARLAQVYGLNTLDSLGLTDSAALSMDVPATIEDAIGLLDSVEVTLRASFSPAIEPIAGWAAGFTSTSTRLTLGSGASITVGGGEATIEL